MKSFRIFKFLFCIVVILSLINLSLTHEGHDHDDEHDHDHDDHDHDDHDHDHNEEQNTEVDQDDQSSDEANEYSNHVQQTISALGFDNMETINREQFRKFYEKLVFMEGEVAQEERDLMEKIYERLTVDLPESLPTKDLPEFIEIGKVYRIINEISESMGLNESPNNNEDNYEDNEAKADL